MNLKYPWNTNADFYIDVYSDYETIAVLFLSMKIRSIDMLKEPKLFLESPTEKNREHVKLNAEII